MLRARWPAVPIEELCARVTSGGTPSRSNPAYYDGGTIPWIKTGELRGWYVDEISERITPSAVRESSAKVFPPETVLLAMYGDGKTMGSVGLIRTPAATNQACCAMLADPKKCDPKFLMYSLVYFRPAILKLAISGAQRNLNGKSIKQFSIGAPPIEVQHRIASILSAYDDLIENNTRRIAILEEMARRIYEEWFVRFRFPGHEGVRMVDSELGLVPEGWRVTRFTDVFDVRYGKGLGTKDLLADGQYPVYGAGGVIGRYDSFIAEGPTCLITSRGNGSGTVWRTVEKAFVTNNSFLVYPKADFTGLNFGFAELFAGQANVKTVVSGSAQPQLTLDGLAGLQVIAPERAVLVRFDALVSPMFDLANKLHFVIRNLRTTRDLLLPKLISGELDLSAVPEPEALAA